MHSLSLGSFDFNMGKEQVPNQHASFSVRSQCLKITEKVSFNITSEDYILSGQKLIKNAKNCQF